MKFRILTLSAFAASLFSVAILSGCDGGGPAAPPSTPSATPAPPITAPVVEVKNKKGTKSKNSDGPAAAN